MKKLKENWLPVIGYEGLYDVSDKGSVRSYPRRVRCVSRSGLEFEKSMPGKLISRRANGYLKVDLAKNGINKSVDVHTIMLLAFVGEPPSGMHCRHLDGDRTNCTLDNVVYGTPIVNSQDRVWHGTRYFSVDEVKFIRKKIQQKTPGACRALACEFGVHISTVYGIGSGKTYSYV